MTNRSLAATLLFATLTCLSLVAQDPQTQPPAGRGRRVSPPQPQQQPGVEYFVGAWTFTWTGRESPVSTGPRTGTLTFVRKGTSDILDMRTEGTTESGTAYKETGTAEWNARTKTMTFYERLTTGVELRSIGDWSSPIGIRAESESTKTESQTFRVRRLYSILSAQSFMVAEEISIDGKPYQRLGNGRFQKTP
jgi:hypothetical protein